MKDHQLHQFTPLNLILTPEPWPDPVEGHALLDEIKSLLTRYVVLPNWAAETISLWIVHTYAFELRDVCTYLGIESPARRCGKNTLLTFLATEGDSAVMLGFG